MKLRQSTLMFELERSHRNKLKEEEKLEQERESEFKREQRVKGKEYDLEKAKQERALDRQRKQDQLAESKRIKQEIKQIMEENFEAEQNFHVMHF
jgi:IS30 family transposase